MKGFKSKGSCYANGGMVRGPGTGTSDSVPDRVPPGTFIMPADSTRQIGAKQLSGMGFKAGMRPAEKPVPDLPLGFKPKMKGGGEVPVNLSSGEFKLPPEQVHAIGAEVLEGIKQATHMPTGETTAQEAGEMEGESDHVSRPALNFADGGLVGDQKKRSMATSPSNTYPGNQAEAAGNIYAKSNEDLASGTRQVGGFIASAFPGTVIGARGAGKAVQDAYQQGGFGAAVGQGARGAMVPAVGFADDVMGGVKRVLDPAAQALKTFVTGDATPIGQERIPAPNQAITPSKAAPASSAAPPAAANPNYGNEPNAPANVIPSAPAGVATSVPGVRRIDEPGKSPLFTNIGPDGQTEAAPQPASLGFRAGMSGGSGLGGPDVLGILQRESKIRESMTPLRDEAAFNGGNGIGFRKVTPDEAIRDMVVRGNSRDRATALGFMAGRQDAADRTGMAQQDISLRQQDALSRQGIAAGEFGLKKEAQGFQSATARRQEALQAQYDAAQTQEERTAIAQKIRDLTGKQDNRFTVVPGGQEWDAAAGAMRNVPAQVFNNQTGQFVTQAKQTPDPRQQEGARLRGKDGKMYQVKNGVPVPV